MQTLPNWILSSPFPSIHDFESLSAIEQTARLYGAMQTMIKEQNEFVDAVTKQIAEFKESEKAAREEFETNITKVLRQFMCCMEQKSETESEGAVG